ncbi:MAG: DUF4124 domain-containing protein [Gammaproteobacteria bacterium]
MKYFLAIALLLFAFSIHAEIYRGVDEEGNVFYSDKDQANAELIPTPTPNAITMPKLEANKPAAEDAEKNPYKSFGIVSPANNATIRDNIGNISITLSLLPALDTKNSHRITIYLDGQIVISATTELTIQLANISRGNHTLSAKVIDGKGKQLIRSNAVTIHMKRSSSQHNKSSGTPPGPKTSDGNPYTPGPQGIIFKPGSISPPSDS